MGDDLLNFNAPIKFTYQFIFISIYFIITREVIDFDRFFSLQIPYKTTLEFLFSVALMTLLVNSINLIDGLDGLSASISLTILSSFVFYFGSTNDIYYEILSITLAGALVGFLLKNKPPPSIISIYLLKYI